MWNNMLLLRLTSKAIAMVTIRHRVDVGRLYISEIVYRCRDNC